MQEVRTLWLDVRSGSLYPVFDVHRGAGGRDGRYTFPDESSERSSTRHRLTVPQDGVLVATGGHLHPGGLWTDLYARAGRQEGAALPLAREVLRARRRRVVGRGDGGRRRPSGASASRPATCSRSARPTTPSGPPGTRRWGSCRSPSTRAAAGPDPFATDVDVRGLLTHGHLDENRNHGGAFGGLADPRKLLAGPVPRRRTVAINDFVYGAGDLLRDGQAAPPAGHPPRVLAEVRQPRRRRGDPALDHLVPRALQPHDGHRLSARRTGRSRFDSGNLGFGPVGSDRRGAARDVEDAEEPARGDLHVLLPRAPLHARRLPRPQALTNWRHDAQPRGGAAGRLRLRRQPRRGHLQRPPGGRLQSVPGPLAA